jgi:ankyrin repeat protein
MIQDSILVCSPDPRIPHTALVDHAADLYAKDNDGIDALGLAKQQGAQSTVELLEARHALDSRQPKETMSGHRAALDA